MTVLATDDTHDESRLDVTAAPRRGLSRHRARLALALAVVALVSAIVGAVGPAKNTYATYSWPPSPLPAMPAARTWYTPLLLERQTPDALTAGLPCSPTAPLPGARQPLVVLATARSPERAKALAVVQQHNRLVVGIGTSTLARLELASTRDAGKDCAYRLRVHDGRYSIAGGPKNVALDGTVPAMPVVDGIFSQAALRSGPQLSVQVRTQAFATQTVPRQTIAWLIAVVALVVALLLVALERTPTPLATTGRLARAALRNARAVDASVLVALAVWWVISPAYYDDGWVRTRQSMFSSVGGFSNYFNGFGANLPNGYWLEWAQHWLTQSSAEQVVLRVPALVSLAAIWVLCRWMLVRVLTPSAEHLVARWTLAGAFLVGAFAWGMTLRPEFATALFTAGTMACAVRFVEREATAPLAVAAVLVPLASTAHHAGIVSAAPIVASGPAVIRWARRNRMVATTVALASAALAATLVFVGSDLAQRLRDAHDARSYLTGTTWLDEAQRYALLSVEPFATPVRAVSVVLMGLTVAAFLLRRRHGKHPLLDLPASTLAVGLLMLAVLPDKFPWHFGALLGVAAVAASAETARLREDAAVSHGWQVRPFVAIAAGIVTSIWVWSSLLPWSPLDLRTLDWIRAFDDLHLQTVVVLLPLVALVAATVAGIVRRDMYPWRVPWRVAPWTALMIAVPVLAFTAGVLVVDTARTGSWTLGRQNVDALRGNAGCGVVDDVSVALPESARPLSPTQRPVSGETPAWIPPFPLERTPRLALGPTGSASSSSPWFRLPADASIGFFAAGTPTTSSDIRLTPTDFLGLVWGSERRGRIRTLPPGEMDVSVEATELGTDPWHFFAAPQLPSRDPRANAVRITLRSRIRPGAAVAVTAPVTYSTTSLASLVDRASTRTLVMPPLVMYLPCAHEPELKHGVAEVPTYIVARQVLGNSPTPVRYGTSPFRGLLDLYPVTYLPVANTSNPVSDFVVFRVDRHIPGAVVVPPTETTSSS